MITRRTLINQIKNYKRRFWVLLLALLFGAFSGAEAGEGEGGKGKVGEVYLIPEPSFLWPEWSVPIEGARRTVQVAAMLDADGDLRSLSKAEVKGIEEADPEWKEKARARAGELLEEIPVRWVRDQDEVVIAAVLDGEEQTVCALLFAPELVVQFEDVFGPEFYVAVPTRFRMYLFPKLATRLGEFAPAVLSDHRVSPHPVSGEVFEVSRDGVVVAGEFDDR